jgi:hypothetical protein
MARIKHVKRFKVVSQIFSEELITFGSLKNMDRCISEGKNSTLIKHRWKGMLFF